MRRCSVALLTVLLLAALAPTAAAQVPAADQPDPLLRRLLGAPRPDSAETLQVPEVPVGEFVATACPQLPPGATEEQVSCGYVGVPLDHDDADGESIALAVAVRRATGAEAAADPLLVLAGGPGEHLVWLFPLLLADGGPLAQLNAERDVILLDQRGVGLSQPALDCPETLTITDLEQFPAATAACHDRLVAEGIDLSAFDTLANAADLDVVREALDYDEWNVFGTSYGARLTLQAAREQSDTMRAQILASPIPAERNFIAGAAAGYDAALERLDEACEADPACPLPGGVRAAVDEILTALQQQPAFADVTDPFTGNVIRSPVTAGVVANGIFQLLYIGPVLPVLPDVIADMTRGDFRSFADLLVSGTPTEGVFFSQGMQLSFLCAEEIEETSLDAMQDDADDWGTAPQVLRETNPIAGYAVFEICEEWDVEPADPTTFEPVNTDIPSLVVTGTYDPITPPEYGEEVADAIPGSVLLEAPDQGHSPLLGLGECGVAILGDFLDDPSEEPDTSCATSRSLEFVTLPLVARARATAASCPPGAVPARDFLDPAADVHAPAVDCLVWWGIAEGYPDGTFRPAQPVTRGQMASFAARMYERSGGQLPQSPPDAFGDDGTSVHHERINQLAALNVIRGRVDGTFGPNDPVSRGQAATFLAGVLSARAGGQIVPPRGDYFDDDAGLPHEPAINVVAEAGITAGAGDGYQPLAPLRREQMASMLARSLDLLVLRGFGAPPG